MDHIPGELPLPRPLLLVTAGAAAHGRGRARSPGFPAKAAFTGGFFHEESINPKAPSVIEWRADDGTALEIKEILMLYARYVPVAGDPATKRFIHYARTCDNR